MAPFTTNYWYGTTSIAALYAAGGGAPATTPAQDLVDTWASGGAGSDGFAMVFEDAGGTDAPSIYVKDSGTPANDTDINLTNDFDAFNSFLTYTSPSPKIVRQSDGNLKYCAHNLCLYSEDVSNAAWTKNLLSVTSGQSDSDGGSDAFLLEVTATSNLVRLVPSSFTVVSGAEYRISVTLANDDMDFVQILFSSTGFATTSWQNVNLTNGTLGDNGGGLSRTTTVADLGGGWYRIDCYAKATSSTSSSSFNLIAADSGTVTRAQNFGGAVGEGFFFHKASFHRAPADTTYLPTTSAARYALPIQHDSSNNAEGLLVEPAATNLVTYSNDFANSYWTENNISALTSADATGPDGATSAFTLTSTSGSGVHNIYTTGITISTATDYAVSIFAKAGTHDYVHIKVGPSDSEMFSAVFDVGASSTETSATETIVGSSFGTVASTRQQAIGNGWFRLSMVGQLATSTAGALSIAFAENATGNSVSPGGAATWSGAAAGTETLIIYCAQEELGSVPTSPIITTGAAATRAVDDLNKALTAIEHSATAGTLYAKYVPRGVATSRDIVRLDDGTANEVISIGQTSGAAARLTVTDGGAAQTAPLTSGTVVAAADNKVAASWAANDFAISEGGAAASTDTSGTLPTVTTFDVGAVNGLVKEVLHLPEAMSDGDLASITT